MLENARIAADLPMEPERLTDRTISRRDFGGMLGVAGVVAGAHMQQPIAKPKSFLGWHCMSNQAIQTLPRASESGIQSILIEQRADLGIGWQYPIDALCHYDFLPPARRRGEKPGQRRLQTTRQRRPS